MKKSILSWLLLFAGFANVLLWAMPPATPLGIVIGTVCMVWGSAEVIKDLQRRHIAKEQRQYRQMFEWMTTGGGSDLSAGINPKKESKDEDI